MHFTVKLIVFKPELPSDHRPECFNPYKHYQNLTLINSLFKAKEVDWDIFQDLFEDFIPPFINSVKTEISFH